MPLSYERAMCSPSFEDNPVGTGVLAGTTPPNLLDPHIAKRPVGFGPIPRSWPVRDRLFGSTVRAALDQPVPEVPDDVDWTFFQAAPVDQRIDYLRGDEMLLLEGLHPSEERIVARLPGARATCEVRGRLSPGGPASQPLELDADALHIDADRLLCTVTWRAALPVANERELPRIGLVMASRSAASPSHLRGLRPSGAQRPPRPRSRARWRSPRTRSRVG